MSTFLKYIRMNLLKESLLSVDSIRNDKHEYGELMKEAVENARRMQERTLSHR